MILASAQTKPKRFDIKANLLDHYRLIEIAANSGANLIVFPEMSITGYERESAASLAFSPADSRLNELIRLATDRKITIVAGAPIQIESNLFIGEFILLPDGSVKMYTKQFLHPGEEMFFTSSFNYNPTLVIDNEKISFAICADIDNPKHPQNAAKTNSSVYIPSIFFSPKGVPSAYNQLGNYAKKYSMNVLMSNFSGESWGEPSGGSSAFWDKHGSLIAAMDDSHSGLLLIEKAQDTWKTKILNDN